MPNNFQLSELTTALVRYLRPHEKESRITYKELSGVVGHPVICRNLAGARKILFRDDKQVWLPFGRGIGIRRLNDQEMAERIGKFHIPGARGKLRRGGDIADQVIFSKLDIDEQNRLAAHSIQIELAMNALSRATHKRVAVARGNSNDLPAFNAVEWAITLSPRPRG